MSVKDLITELSRMTSSHNNDNEIEIFEKSLSKKIKQCIAEESFFTDLPFDNIFHILKNIDYDDNILSVGLVKTIIQKLNQRDPERAISLLLILSQPYSTLTENISILTCFNQCPLFSQLGILFNEYGQQMQLDFEYELERKDEIISHLHKELLKARFPTQESMPHPFEPNIFKATENGMIQSIQYLIEHNGVDFNLTNDNGLTPLIIACQKGHLDIVQYLIEKEHANVDTIDNDKQTPLMWAALCGHFHIVRYLVEVPKANKDLFNKKGLSVLHLAVEGGSLQIVKYLIEKIHMDVNMPTQDGISPLSIALQHNNDDIVEFLLSHGAN